MNELPVKSPQVIPRVAVIEIPVTDVHKSVEWYEKILGAKPIGDIGDSAVFMRLNGADKDATVLRLVKTNDYQRLRFISDGITYSVIEFYSDNVPEFLEHLRQQKVPINGTSGFFDPDGNSFAVIHLSI
jgi:glyoxylase I family protein